MYHIYRARKKVRIINAKDWAFQHGAKGNWYVGYTYELSYKAIDDLDFEYFGYMSSEEFERVIG